MLNWAIYINLVLSTYWIVLSVAENIRGVNLGGWLLVEEWITPSLFRSTRAEDEWNLCNTLGKEECLKRLEEHWSSFITRDDFEDMKSAGLNAIRIPIGYWAVDILSEEPYVAGQYPYLIQAVQWSSECGFQVMIDLHGAPGSQNGQDNSGLIGPVLFPSNSSNSDRSLDILRNLTEEFSQDIYGGAVKAIELLNEPRLDDDSFPMSQLKDFYSDGVKVVSSANAFWGPSYWSTYTPLANKSQSQPQPTLILDSHQYYAFAPLANLSRPEILSRICKTSHLLKNTSSSTSHPTIIGEFSLETNSTPVESHHRQNQNNNNNNKPSQSQRTWYRLLFEAQVAAYSPSPAATNPSLGAGGGMGGFRLMSGIGGTFVFPLLGEGEDVGCVDVDFAWEAPAEVGGAVRRMGMGMGEGRLGWWVGFVVLIAVVVF
ncbi:hypothetical protein Q7P36_001660 [Cladosporium allicinum]